MLPLFQRCPRWCQAQRDVRLGIISAEGEDACPLRGLFGHDVSGFQVGHRREWQSEKGDAMPRVIVTAEVENVEKWEKGFRTHGDLFRQMGVSRMEFATGPGNRIAVCGETNNLDAYMKIYNSPTTAEAMASDGVKRETVQAFVLDKELKV
jgi:hypothetical protein